MAKIKMKRIALLIATSVFILVMLTAPLFITEFLNTDNAQEETGVYDVTFGNPVIYNETVKGNQYAYAFIQAKVKVYDDGSYLEKLSRIEVKVYLEKDKTDSLISHTVWKALRDIKGSFMIGASIVIHDVDIPADGTILFVVVEYKVDRLFTSTVGMYETSFEYNYIHP